MTKIEWTDETWNPVTGCRQISEGCANCYAKRLFPRVYNRPFSEVMLHHDRLDQPERWKKPRRIFVPSMGDLFHEDVPGDFIREVYKAMLLNPQHVYQVLTKRAERMQECVNTLWTMYRKASWAHIWHGVSVENQLRMDIRVEWLINNISAVQFLSLEPLLGPVIIPANWLYFRGTRQWVIVGGESGPGARPMDLDWVRDIRDQCNLAGVPFFFKQRIVNGKKVSMPKLDGKVWKEYPDVQTRT